MEKLNITELLKDCPKGMELDCLLYNNVTFLRVDDDKHTIFPIKVLRSDGCELRFTKYGQYANMDDAKCVIFPKGKTTWKGFVPPCKFKDGDILFVKAKYSWILIYKESKNIVEFHSYIAIPDYLNYTSVVYNCNSLCYKDDISKIRHATKEEKQKLFDAIKDDGYCWNEETKTLEKLDKRRFKIGNRIKSKINQYEYTIIDVTKDSYIVRYKTDKFNYYVPFCNENNYDLIPNKFDINTLVPFESKVLIRNDKHSNWKPAIFGCYMKDKTTLYYYVLGGICWKYCIPYEGNEHLINKTDDCDEFYKTW